jgi:hypothetical protein
MIIDFIVQSVPITTKVVSLNPVHGKVYSIQHYVIKFVSDLRQVGGFTGTPVSSTNKTDRHLITDILLKVALNAINLGASKPKGLNTRQNQLGLLGLRMSGQIDLRYNKLHDFRN